MQVAVHSGALTRRPRPRPATFTGVVNSSLLKRGRHVSFEAVAQALFEDSRDLAEVADAFQKTYGSLIRYEMAPSIRAGVALTVREGPMRFLMRRSRRLYLHCVRNPSDPEVWKLINRAEELRIEGDDLLLSHDRRSCLEMLYGIVARLVSAAATTPRDAHGRAIAPDHMRDVEAELEAVRRFIDRAERRASVLMYLAGIGGGVLIVSLLSALISFSALGTDTGLLSAVFAAGAIGAVVSVMSRMSSGSFSLPARLGWLHTALLGTFRPAIGSISAVAVFFFLVGGFGPATVDVEADKQLYFFTAIGFLAGFSERFAKNMFVAAERAAGAGAGTAPPSLEPPAGAEAPSRPALPEPAEPEPGAGSSNGRTAALDPGAGGS